MSGGNKAFDQEQLRAFLLGSLSAGEEQQISDAAEGDAELRAALEIAESSLVDDYVMGSLSGEEREAFEANYLLTKQRQQRVDLARRLLLEAEAADVWRQRRWMLAAAAVVVVSLGIGAWGFLRPAPDRGVAMLALNGNATRADSPEFQLANVSGTVLVLEIPVHGAAVGAVVATLKPIGGDAEVLRLTLPGASAAKVLIPVPVAALAPGDYLVTLDSGSAFHLESVFRVVP